MVGGGAWVVGLVYTVQAIYIGLPNMWDPLPFLSLCFKIHNGQIGISLG